jgi:hypothetical protein
MFYNHQSRFGKGGFPSAGCAYPSSSAQHGATLDRTNREKRLAGLANATCSEKRRSRSLPEQAIKLIEGLALQTPQRSAAAIHRQMAARTTLE